MAEERVQKIIAQSGLCARRQAEVLIAQGRVRVNGKVIKIGSKADPMNQLITVDGKPLRKERFRYLVFYKPQFCICTSFDPQGRRTVFDFLPKGERLFTVGRLDYDTEGLLIVTNDGEFANRMTHPSFEVRKVYLAQLDRALSRADADRIAHGLVIDGRLTKVYELRHRGNVVTIGIHEGRKHIVKRLFEAAGYKVRRLKRTQVGTYTLRKLRPAEFYEFSPE